MSRRYQQLIPLNLLCLFSEYMMENPSPERVKFTLGRIVATQGAIAGLTSLEIGTAIARHARGDWGDLCKEDRELNETALADDGRLFSAYHTEAGKKFYVITEWDRSVTTVLLPEEY